jgi:hypothetical protein
MVTSSAALLTLDNKPPSGVVSSLLHIAFGPLMQTVYKDAALVRSLRVLNALTQRQDIGDLAEPALDTLGLSAETTVDPFTGKQLMVHKLASGWLIYSVGPDLKDDGGKLNHHHDIGLEPPDTGVPDDDALPPSS